MVSSYLPTLMQPIMAENGVLVESNLPPGLGPTEADWARYGGKPPVPQNYQEICAQAHAERDDHAGRVAQSEEMLLWLDRTGQSGRRAFFQRHAEHIESGEIELGYVSDLIDEHVAYCSFIASMMISFEAKYRQAIDQEEATAKEDFFHYWFECWEDAHHRSGNGPLRQELPAYLSICAMLATFQLYDPGNTEIGLRTRMVNPLTVFPVWEGDRGLAHVYRVYNDTASHVVGNFGTPDGQVLEKIAEIAPSADPNCPYEYSYVGEVIEYWDRNWGCVLFEDKLIRVWEHGRGKVPWIITPGSFGPPHGMDTSILTQPLADGRHIETFGASRGNRWENLRRTYQPYLQRRLEAHIQDERAAGVFMTLLRRSLNPALVHKQDPMSAALGEAEIETQEGGRSKIGSTDDLAPLEGLPVAEVTQPLLAILDRNRLTGMPASMQLGSLGASSSGTAVDIATQTGNRSWMPLIMGVQDHLRELAEDAAEQVLLFGPVMGSGLEGAIPVPRRRAPNMRTGQAPAHEVTPDLIRRTGIRVAVTLRQFDPATLGPTANGLVIAASQGWVDERSAISILGFTDDIEGVIQRRRLDQLNQVPEIQMADTITELNAMAEEAVKRGDLESAQKLATRAFFVASMMQAKLMMAPGLASGMGNPGTAEDAMMQQMPGTPPPQEMPEGMIQFQGASMPQFGGSTGTEGGNPGGPNDTLSGGVPPPPPPAPKIQG